MKPLLNIQFLQISSFLTLLFFTFLLSSTPFAATLRRLSFSCAAFALLPFFFHFLITRRLQPVFLLSYACYKPPPHRKCSFLTAESFVRRCGRFSPEAIDFMCNICRKSGLGDETYAPPFIFEEEGVPLLRSAIQEAEEGIFSAIDGVLAKTLIHPLDIDIVIVTCGSFSPSPSLSSLIVNRYNLRADVKTYNLSGMGCSSGVISVDLAARVLRGNRKVQNALVVITESITLNWYNGDSRPMLVTNCIFRVGCAAAMITNDPSHRSVAKMELVDTLRTHHCADDGAQLVQYAYSTAAAALSCGDQPKKPPVPDFTTAFQHLCIHTGGKAVIENVGRVLKLSPAVTEPARMSLNRFGNTSSSLVFYELAYFEAKRRAKKGDKMWMLAFGTGFKVGSLVWKWRQDSTQELDNPWMDCIHNYPLEPC
ncbi:UNVERIFIED_CONTAM: 3-ketoacyl-CoA synthase 17 [Sesamum radiatum]|uniref:3-ketoacyl-CoA synthase n=1 Tax=Sesamum radiatum TaxID=300843 RepID=A0AAW2Q271_SESRA